MLRVRSKKEVDLDEACYAMIKLKNSSWRDRQQQASNWWLCLACVIHSRVDKSPSPSSLSLIPGKAPRVSFDRRFPFESRVSPADNRALNLFSEKCWMLLTKLESVSEELRSLLTRASLVWGKSFPTPATQTSLLRSIPTPD